MTPLSIIIDSLAARISMYEKGQVSTELVMTLKSNIIKLKQDVDQLKSTNLSMIFGTVVILDVVQMSLGDEVRVQKTIYLKFEVEADEKMLGVLRMLHIRDLLRLRRPW